MDAVPTSSRETASGDPSPLAAPLQRRGAEGPRFTFSVAAGPASRTQTCLVKNRTAKVAENAAPPCRPGWPGRSPCPPGGELPPVCTSVPLDRQPGHTPGPKHLAKEPESGPREAGDPQLHAGQLAPPPFSGLEPGWAREPVRSRSGRTRATPSLCVPRPLARLNPGLGGGLTPGLQSSRPESCRSGRHLSLPPEDAPSSACHFPSPAPSASFPKGPAKLPTFSFTPFSSLQLLGLALCVGYECLFFFLFFTDFRAFWGKKKNSTAHLWSPENIHQSQNSY